jgi:Flp pilus assembly protein protease CpaA
VQLMKRTVGAGLGTMGAVALAAAIWPAVAGLVAGLLVTALCAGTGTLAVLGGRRVRAQLAWRRELRSMPPLDVSTYGDAVADPTLAQLRESA